MVSCWFVQCGRCGAVLVLPDGRVGEACRPCEDWADSVLMGIVAGLVESCPEMSAESAAVVAMERRPDAARWWRWSGDVVRVAHRAPGGLRPVGVVRVGDRLVVPVGASVRRRGGVRLAVREKVVTVRSAGSGVVRWGAGAKSAEADVVELRLPA